MQHYDDLNPIRIVGQTLDGQIGGPIFNACWNGRPDLGKMETHSIAGKLNSLELVLKNHQNGRFWVKMFFLRCPFHLYSDKFSYFFWPGVLQMNCLQIMTMEMIGGEEQEDGTMQKKRQQRRQRHLISFRFNQPSRSTSITMTLQILCRFR